MASQVKHLCLFGDRRIMQKCEKATRGHHDLRYLTKRLVDRGIKSTVTFNHALLAKSQRLLAPRSGVADHSSRRIGERVKIPPCLIAASTYCACKFRGSGSRLTLSRFPLFGSNFAACDSFWKIPFRHAMLPRVPHISSSPAKVADAIQSL